MSKSIAILLLSLFSFSLNAQKLDLIVTQENDSIACKIDSITSEVIYFKIKRNSVYSGQINQENVVAYERKAISKGKIRYIEGTINFNTKASVRGNKRATKRREKDVELEKGYEAMKTLVRSGAYKFFADRATGRRSSQTIDLYGKPDNYITIKKNEYSAGLYGLSLKSRTGEIPDLSVIESDVARKIQVKFSIADPGGYDTRFGKLELLFTIFPDSKTVLVIKDDTGAIKTTYYGTIKPISDW